MLVLAHESCAHARHLVRRARAPFEAAHITLTQGMHLGAGCGRTRAARGLPGRGARIARVNRCRKAARPRTPTRWARRWPAQNPWLSISLAVGGGGRRGGAAPSPQPGSDALRGGAQPCYEGPWAGPARQRGRAVLSSGLQPETDRSPYEQTARSAVRPRFPISAPGAASAVALKKKACACCPRRAGADPAPPGAGLGADAPAHHHRLQRIAAGADHRRPPGRARVPG